MSQSEETNKFKLFNDPIYGFIAIPSELIFDLIEHPFFQRLRRIGQLGLSSLVYPGAYHTRFHHALGAMHLTQKAISVLQSKGHNISKSESESVQIAILLHDIGHGPFSHALEHTLIDDITHESLSLMLMQRLNNEMKGKLTEAIQIFTNKHPKRFLYQLVSSQLDMDRLDYLKRDAFYTGVVEGSINSERLISMLNIANGELVLDNKGVSSVQKFLVSRSLMYWQVYMHKAVLCAENMLVKLLSRAHEIAQIDETMFGGKELLFFLVNRPSKKEFESNPNILNLFTQLDDSDILAAMKQWRNHKDFILSDLSSRLLDRKLFQIKFLPEKINSDKLNYLEKSISDSMGITLIDSRYFILEGTASNSTYVSNKEEIKILNREGNVIPLSAASEILPLSVYSHTLTRPFVCWPKEIKWTD
tara:strand:+ start:4086 stop:5339 length:1254 start_codon:yes stop_codon:yes gene_type:complete